MSPGNDPAPADKDALACVRRLVREASPGAPGLGGAEATDLARGRLVLTPAHRVGEAPAPAGARPAPLLLLSEALSAAPPPDALPTRSREPAAPDALPLDEAALRRLVAEAVREALAGEAIRDLVRREVLQALDDRGA